MSTAPQGTLSKLLGNLLFAYRPIRLSRNTVDVLMALLDSSLLRCGDRLLDVHTALVAAARCGQAPAQPAAADAVAATDGAAGTSAAGGDDGSALDMLARSLHALLADIVNRYHEALTSGSASVVTAVLLLARLGHACSGAALLMGHMGTLWRTVDRLWDMLHLDSPQVTTFRLGLG